MTKEQIAEATWKWLADDGRNVDMLVNRIYALQSEADQRDAARYRWLRNQDERMWVRFRAEDGLECDLFGHDLDTAIDAAMASSADIHQPEKGT